MPETEQLPEDEDVEGHGLFKPGAGDAIDPPDASRSDDEDVEAHGFFKPGAGDTIDPPDAS